MQISGRDDERRDGCGLAAASLTDDVLARLGDSSALLSACSDLLVSHQLRSEAGGGSRYDGSVSAQNSQTTTSVLLAIGAGESARLELAPVFFEIDVGDPAPRRGVRVANLPNGNVVSR